MSVQEKIHQILWDRRYVQVPEDVALPGFDYIVIRDMTVEDRNVYTFVRKMELEASRKAGVPTEVELLAQSRTMGLWTQEDDLVLSNADEHIQFLNDQKDKQKFLARKKSIQVDIDATIEKKRATTTKKSEIYLNSADYYANEAAAHVLIRRVAMKIDGTPIWTDDTTFLYFKQNHIAFLMFVINQVLSEGIMDIDEIREIARNPEWRLTWTLQRENLPGIFGRNVGDLSINHKLLVYWSRVYDSALESTEPPSIDIINDDEKFDDWLANRDLDRKEKHESKGAGHKEHQERIQMLTGEYSDACNCGAKDKNVGKGLGERMQHLTTCPYGTFRYYSQQEKEQIARKTYSRNSDRVRTILEQEQQAVIENGLVEEQHLRGKKTRHILGMPTDVTSTHRK